MLIPFVLSDENVTENTTNSLLKESISDYIHLYNENMPEVPSMVAFLFKHERINIYIDEELICGVTTNNGRVSDNCSEVITNPTINVFMSRSTFDKLDSREMNINDALRNRLIEYKGVTVINKFKLGFLSIIQRIFMRPEKTA